MYYVYILANVIGTVVYTGITNNVVRRVYEHKHNLDPSSYAAISREKQIKSWSRKKKNELVESMNPEWEDLYDSLL